jgi:hypothetical protein
VAASVDDLAPAGINWQTAMENAALQLREADKHKNVSVKSDLASVAQAWIAYAREITMHAGAAS